ncbi:DEAD/DEAH box helicase family protein [Nocardia iowensis]|uniref:Helicase ATP-binding domain-containing protein n=1 Tax=Nocardia iowensis TaxID=204891 RepID=A0ABX8RZT8_NOCIO|nr:DEAD/DEAH box helicase family protein [Nocardia iowensis]QXN94497.1 hypothetical protein KV110_16460 [Nocardia iowensis]
MQPVHPDTAFRVVTSMRPAGDQPAAIATLAARIAAGERHSLLHGATGIGKTATLAWLAERVQLLMLIIAPNKLLARYLPKDAITDGAVDAARYQALESLLVRRDVIVVATVSAIYGMATPADYYDHALTLRTGTTTYSHQQLLDDLVAIVYRRDDTRLQRSGFRLRGDTIEVMPTWGGGSCRIESFGDEIEAMHHLEPDTGRLAEPTDKLMIFPTKRHIALAQRIPAALIQTIGRAARNIAGEMHLYADTTTPAMHAAITETDRRRARQLTHNQRHGITAHTVSASPTPPAAGTR